MKKTVRMTPRRLASFFAAAAALIFPRCSPAGGAEDSEDFHSPRRLAVRPAIVILAALLASSCSSCGGERAGDGDATEVDAEGEGAEPTDVLEEADLPDASDAGREPERDAGYNLPEGCNVPVVDLGDGIEQVTCLHSVYPSWDVSNGKVAYGPGFTAHGLAVKELDTGREYMVREEDEDFRMGLFHGMFSFSGSYACYEGGGSVVCTDIRTGVSTDLLYCENPWLLDGPAECCSPGEAGYPDIQGSKVVWCNCTSEEFPASKDLYLFDFDSMEHPGEARRLTFDRHYWLVPSIWGNRVVFERSNDLRMIDIESGEQRVLLEDMLSSDFADPQIWEDIVVWSKSDRLVEGYPDYNVYWCRIPDCEPTPATTNWADQVAPAVEGEWIVWYDLRNDRYPSSYPSPSHENTEIWGKNIRTGDEVQLVSINRVISNHLKIDGGKVFFRAHAVKDEVSTSAVFMKELPSL